MSETNQVSFILCSTVRSLTCSSNFDRFQHNADPNTRQDLSISAITSWYLHHTVTTMAVWADELLGFEKKKKNTEVNPLPPKLAP
jgi:hypothetical protein